MATTATEEGRARILYGLNIAVTSALAVWCLAWPACAARSLFGDARAAGGLMAEAASTGSPALLSYRMLGGWWAAIALVSLLGLREPLKFSPIFLIQIAYKFAFLGTAIVPHLAARRYGVSPALPTAVFAGFLAPLFLCTPWSYLLGGHAKRGAVAEPVGAGVERKAE